MQIIDTSKVNIMLDLETLSTHANAAIVSLGAVFFDDEKLIDDFYCAVSVSSNINNRRHIAADTLVWWMRQSNEARALFNDAKAISIKQCLIDFQTWCLACRKDIDTDTSSLAQSDIMLWGNGSDFDNVILADAYTQFHYRQPWEFNNNRCFRTLKNIYSCVEKPKRQQDIKHNALDDAYAQVKHLWLINNAMKQCGC